MATKTLKLKRVIAWSIYDNLRKTAPKMYPTTGEIKATISDILPAFKPEVERYADIIKRAEELSVSSAAKELPEAEIRAAVDALNAEWKEYNKTAGEEVIEIELSADGFSTLKAQFDRDGEVFGKRWTANLEEFDELSQAFAQAAKETK